MHYGILIYITFGFHTGRKSVRHAVFYQEASTTSYYLYATDIPQLTQFTMCFWLKWATTTRLSNYPFSFSNSRKSALYYLSNCQGVASLCYVPWNSKNRFLLSLLFNHCIVIAYYHLFIYLKRFSWVSYINGSLLIIGCSFADSFTIMLIKKEIAALSKPNDVANISYFYAIVFVCTWSKLPSMY